MNSGGIASYLTSPTGLIPTAGGISIIDDGVEPILGEIEM